MCPFQPLMENDSFNSKIKSNKGEIERASKKDDIVDVYRNLNKPSFFSIRQVKNELKGKVSGYANIIVMENPLIKISETSRLRVLRDKRKNVHAFIRGRLHSAYSGSIQLNTLQSITYNPYKMGSFYFCENNEEVVPNDLLKYAVFYGSNVYLTDDISGIFH